MKPRDRREKQRQDLREKILSAARELLLAEGITGFSMRKLAAKVGYTATAIYSYFADRDDVLRAIMDADCVALRRAMDDAASEADPLVRIRKMGLAYVGFGFQHPDHYRLLMLTTHDPNLIDSNDPRRTDPAQDAYALLRQAAADCVAARRCRPEFKDPEQLAQMFWSAVHGIVALHLTHGNDPVFQWRPAVPTASLLIDAIVRGLALPK